MNLLYFVKENIFWWTEVQQEIYQLTNQTKQEKSKLSLNSTSYSKD